MCSANAGFTVVDSETELTARAEAFAAALAAIPRACAGLDRVA